MKMSMILLSIYDFLQYDSSANDMINQYGNMSVFFTDVG